ncbi:MAG: hypothetical protein ACRDQB_10125 [Thermocrispum sp.]
MEKESSQEFSLKVQRIPSDHMVVGYVAYLKVLDENGDMYFAQRIEGINDMEALGMATDMQNNYQVMLENSVVEIEDEGND